MSLTLCKLCGKVYDSASSFYGRSICIECQRKLEAMYVKVHKYINDHGGLKNFDVNAISEEVEMDLSDIKILMDLGFFERDIQTYSNIPSERQRMAKEFSDELDRMIERKKATNYGGKIYRRKIIANVYK